MLRFYVIATFASAALLGSTMAATIGGLNAAPTLATAGPAMMTPPPRTTAPPQFAIPVRLGTAAPLVMPATPALDGRYLRARRTASGYTLTGQALAKDACQGARFDRVLGNLFPPEFYLNQSRRPGTMGLMCVQRLTWVTVAPLMVASKARPNWVTVRTKKKAYRVPVQ